MTLKRAFHEILGNGLYNEAEQYVQIMPFQQFGAPSKSLEKKARRAKKQLGDKWCLYPKERKNG